MSLKRRLSLRCLLWAVSLSGCAGVTVPEGRQVPAHAEHDLVIDNHSSGSLAVHVGRTKAEAKDHRIGEVWPLDEAAFEVDGPRCGVWVAREDRPDLEWIGTWEAEDAPVSLEVR